MNVTRGHSLPEDPSPRWREQFHREPKTPGQGLRTALLLPTACLRQASHLLGTAVGQPLLAVAVKATGAPAGGTKGQRRGGVGVGWIEKLSPSFPPIQQPLPQGSAGQAPGDHWAAALSTRRLWNRESDPPAPSIPFPGAGVGICETLTFFLPQLPRTKASPSPTSV